MKKKIKKKVAGFQANKFLDKSNKKNMMKIKIFKEMQMRN